LRVEERSKSIRGLQRTRFEIRTRTGDGSGAAARQAAQEAAS
jgi:hypothetical protein